MPNEYSNHSVVLTLAASTVNIGSIGSMDLPLDHSVVQDAGGASRVQARSVAKIGGLFRAQTTALDRFFANVPPSGACVGSAATVRGVTFNREKKVNCQSTAVTSSSHLAVAVGMGYLYPRTISASARDATVLLDFEMRPLSDGVNAPWSVNAAATLPTIASGDASQFVFGYTQVGGVIADSHRDLNIDLGVKLTEPLVALADVYDYSVSLEQFDPAVTFTISDLSRVALTGSQKYLVGGLAAAQTNTRFWFRKRQPNGSFYAPDQAVHAYATMAGLLVPEGGWGSASGRSIGTTRCKFYPVNDGTNEQIVLNLNQTYQPLL